MTMSLFGIHIRMVLQLDAQSAPFGSPNCLSQSFSSLALFATISLCTSTPLATIATPRTPSAHGLC